jgi:WD40 repeat protein
VGAAGLLLGGGLSLWLVLSNAQRPGPPVASLPFLDQMDGTHIPAAERYPEWQPPELVAVLGEHRRRLWGSVTSVAFLPDSKVLVSRGTDHAVRLWDVATGREVAALQHGDVWGIRMALSPDGTMLALNKQAQVILWDLTARKQRYVMEGSFDVIHCLAFAPDNKLLAAGCRSREGDKVIHRVMVWETATGRSRGTWAGHEENIWAVAFARDGHTLASAGQDQKLIVWDVQDGKRRETISTHDRPVVALAYSPDGKTLASGDTGGKVCLREPATGSKHSLTTDQIWSMAFAPDSKTLAVAGVSAGLMDPAGRRATVPLAGHQGIVTTVAYAPDGSVLATGSADSTIRLWDPATGLERDPLVGHRPAATCVAIAPDGRTVATGSWDHTAKLWDVAAARERVTLKGHDASVNCVAFAPGEPLLATGSRDGTIRLWDTANGAERGQRLGHTDEVLSVAFSPDGQMLASGGKDHEVLLWQVSAQTKRRIAKHGADVTCMAFAADGKSLAAGDRAGMVKLWEVETGKELATFHGVNDKPVAVESVALAPHGRTVLIGRADGSLVLWDVPSSSKPVLRPGHQAAACLVGYAPDGRTLVSASRDGHLIRWGSNATEKLWEHRYPGGIHGAALAPDGRHVLTANLNGTVYILRLASPLSAP